MRVAVFRWRALVPLLVLGTVGVGLWLVFADRIVKHAAESVGTTLVGAKVEIEALHLDLPHGRVEIHGLTVASPFEPLRNLLRAEALVADVEPLPLLEKKVVIDRLAATGLKFGTPRATDGRTGTTSDGLMGQVSRWGNELRVPALELARGKISVARLDPATLNTPRTAAALAARADSARKVWEASLAGLDAGAAADSARRMVERLRGAKATDLQLLGDARRTLERLKQAQDRVTGLERSVTSGIGALQAGVADLADAKQRDYASARRLLKLPGLDAPDIGAALFGSAAVDRFQRALYWAELGRRYMPPGLLPRATPGPQRARRAGATVRFPRAHENPAFLLKTAELSLELAALGAAAPARTYAARLTGVTSDPALYGRPATASATAPGFRLDALLDHVRPTPRDTAAATLAGVALPPISLPALLIRLEPGAGAGAGAVTLSFSLQGDQVRARWTVHSDRIRWVRDSGGGVSPSPIGDLVWRVVSGIPTLDVSASLAGSLAHPQLAVSSNLDRALAERVRAVAGAELAAADARVRAQVDSLVDGHVAPVRAQVTTLGGDVGRRLGGQGALLADARKALEQRLRELTKLPGLRLP
jgi:uncharacterized protein (TIGR03545 family)